LSKENFSFFLFSLCKQQKSLFFVFVAVVVVVAYDSSSSTKFRSNTSTGKQAGSKFVPQMSFNSIKLLECELRKYIQENRFLFTKAFMQIASRALLFS